MRHKIAISIVCLLLVGVVSAVLQCSCSGSETGARTELTKFSSYWELKNFLKDSTQAYAQLRGGVKAFASDETASLSAGGDYSLDYSATNIQVEGVDEADIVKTDGQFIYLVSGKTVFIVKAYPSEEARILSKIELDETVVGLFINGDRLIVLENQGGIYATREYWAEDTGPVIPAEPKTCVKVYDVSDRESPILTREIAVDGEYVGTRMVGDYVYAIVSKPAYEQDDEISLPKIDLGNGETTILPPEIYKCDVEDYGYIFTTIVAVNTQKDDEEAARQTLLLGASSNLYVSLENIYITSTRWLSGGDSEETAVHRIHIEEGKIEYQASGEFPGRVLNQFSMDEYQGVFRVATTTWEQAGFERGATSQNNLYVLDANLDVVGRLENLAPGESIYSARFMGERCYLVTFVKIDPLFVIDLRDPYNPKVLGELKVTGYSDYLHPYDENHIIGIGKEAVEAVEGDFAWYQGVKIALFDVSDVENPKEVAKYEIGDRGTDSEALRDHKAFLLDQSRDLLVLPILLAEIDQSKYPYPDPSAYGEYVWQGAYVFDISLEEGFQLRGGITHYENGGDLSQEGYYFGGPESVQRSLYIGDVLYTISQAKIKVNSLENLDYINEVELQ